MLTPIYEKKSKSLRVRNGLLGEEEERKGRGETVTQLKLMDCFIYSFLKPSTL